MTFPGFEIEDHKDKSIEIVHLGPKDFVDLASIGLKAGEIILSGSQSPLVPVVAGDSLTCNVGGLGGTSVRFI